MRYDPRFYSQWDCVCGTTGHFLRVSRDGSRLCTTVRVRCRSCRTSTTLQCFHGTGTIETPTHWGAGTFSIWGRDLEAAVRRLRIERPEYTELRNLRPAES
jgi:hypothetical protein